MLSLLSRFEKKDPQDIVKMLGLKLKFEGLKYIVMFNMRKDPQWAARMADTGGQVVRHFSGPCKQHSCNQGAFLAGQQENKQQGLLLS